MRFEIGPGGGFVILVGLLGLSAAVFFLGMISGREMAQSEQNQSQLASVYPMPAGAPAALPSQAAAPSGPAAAAATPKPPSHPAIASAHTPRAAMPEPAHEHKAPPRPTLANLPPEHPSAPAEEESDTGYSAGSDSSESSASDRTATGAEEGAARAPAADAATRHHGYNIVIDAAMDRAAANRMESRLLGLGYTSRIVPSQINGQTWYRVQVGPYPTEEDARSAQAQLRAAYTARYVNRSRTTGTAPDVSDPGSEDSGDSADTGPTD
jgi:DedD protein